MDPSFSLKNRRPYMSRLLKCCVPLGAVLIFVVSAAAQPPDGPPGGPGRPEGTPPPPGAPGLHMAGPGFGLLPGGMPPFEPGRVLPTPLRDELDLTEEQDRQVDDL